MGCTINLAAYENMLDEDIQWLLDNSPKSYQRDRIIEVMKAMHENEKEYRKHKEAMCKNCKSIGV